MWFLLAYISLHLHHGVKSHTSTTCYELPFSRNETAFLSPLPIICKPPKREEHIFCILGTSSWEMTLPVTPCSTNISWKDVYALDIEGPWPGKFLFFSLQLKTSYVTLDKPWIFTLVSHLWKNIIVLVLLRSFKDCKALRYCNRR